MFHATISGHVFDGHLLQPLHQNPELNSAEEHIWTSLYLFLCLFLLTFIKNRALNRAVRVVQSTFSPQIFYQLQREEINATKSYSLGLNLFFILNLSFLIYKYNSFNTYLLQNKNDFFQFFFFFVLILVFILLRSFGDQLMAVITDQRKLLAEYRTSVSLINQAFGLFLFPWVILAEFTQFNSMVFVACGAAVLVTSVLLKWYRGMVMGLLEQRVGLLQIFSYFCALEILPLLVVVKFLIETF